jgi:hypothetical protein
MRSLLLHLFTVLAACAAIMGATHADSHASRRDQAIGKPVVKMVEGGDGVKGACFYSSHCGVQDVEANCTIYSTETLSDGNIELTRQDSIDGVNEEALVSYAEICQLSQIDIVRPVVAEGLHLANDLQSRLNNDLCRLQTGRSRKIICSDPDWR